jgi:hypothetical protein
MRSTHYFILFLKVQFDLRSLCHTLTVTPSTPERYNRILNIDKSNKIMALTLNFPYNIFAKRGTTSS